jgi:two-component system chemotaxis response regulator CheB
MPEMDGVETLEHIRRDFPDVFTVMISGATTRHADITIRALELGAIDFIPKPHVEGYEAGLQELTKALGPILQMIRLKRLTKGGAEKEEAKAEEAAQAKPAPTAPTRFAAVPDTFDIALIGVSTGGPNALREVIAELPADYPIPILVVQHMPPLFTASLAKNLAKDAALDVREAQDEEAVKPGAVLIAPGGRHMTVRSGAEGLRIGLNDSPPVHSCKPAVDVLFRSVGAVVKGGVLAVILTGMGEDGTAGVMTLKRKGCFCITQSEETCVVYGMPRSVVERGLSDEVAALGSIAGRMTELARR